MSSKLRMIRSCQKDSSTSCSPAFVQTTSGHPAKRVKLLTPVLPVFRSSSASAARSRILLGQLFRLWPTGEGVTGPSPLRRKIKRGHQTFVAASTMMATPGSGDRKVAIITGVARHRGIGWAIVTAFLKEGYNVLGADIRELEGAPRREVEVEEAGSASFHFCQADIAKPEEAGRLVETAVAKFGRQIHAVVNNAGRSHPFLDGSEPLAEFDSYIRNNLNSAYYVSACAAPYMPAGSSSIVHISSTRARMSEPGCEGYAAAKAGLCGLTHAQALSLAGKVRVNAILPGWIVTDEETEKSLREEDHLWHPAGRVGVPDDVAQLCVFLCNEQRAGFITGQEFVVDGGVTRKMVYPE